MDKKRLKRATEKVFFNYHGDFMKLRDLLRSTLQFNSIRDLIHGFEKIVQACENQGAKHNVKIVRIKNKLDPDDGVASDILTGGYRDLQLLLNFEGLIVELQLNLRDIMINKHASHKVYGLRRLLLPGDDDTTWAEQLRWLVTCCTCNCNTSSQSPQAVQMSDTFIREESV